MKQEALKGERRIIFSATVGLECPVYEREKIPPGSRMSGPAVIEEPLSTTLIRPEDHCRVDDLGNIIIEKKG